MSLSRAELKEWGIDKPEIVDKIMAGYGASVNSRLTKEEAETQTKLAVEKALEDFKKTIPAPIKVEDTNEYKSLLAKVQDYELGDKLREAKVKTRYIPFVKQNLDTKDIDKSLAKIKTDYAEFFEADGANKAGDNGQGQSNRQKQPLPTFANNQTNLGTGEKTKAELLKEQFLQGFRGF